MAHPLTLNLVMQKARADRPGMVKRLNVSGSQVDDISVLEQFTALEVCSLAVNDVSDLAPLATCDKLRELFLRKNDVVDLFQVLHLRGIAGLRVLTLSENPVSQHDCYRRYVIAALPQLEKLDEIDVTAEERDAAHQEFPDVTACEIPLPLPTKRELHGTKSGQHSPQLKRGGSGQFNPPSADSAPLPSARRSGSTLSPSEQPKPTQQLPSRPPQTLRRDDSSDAYTEGDSGPDAGAQARYDDIPVGGSRPRPKPVTRAPPQRFTDPAPSGRKQHDSPCDTDEHADDSTDSLPAVQNDSFGSRQQQAGAQPRSLATARLSAPSSARGSRPTIPLSPQPMGIREENVVRAINVLLGELSPAGLDAIRRQLDMLEMR